ncbi:hypothetical protein BMS3Abin03_01220 [bacterium BMS3Abin03]|nr:hypothetical protein BMS3Abin03_01220 [bacterium BMS3Abin03]HDZ58844.1 hypothetical protein [Ignavibacteriales bacterium]
MEMTKYETLINDLNTLESRITILKSQYDDTVERNKELEVALEKAKQDNTALYQKLASLDEELNELKSKTEGMNFGSLNLEERESLKGRLQKLISRIDYHLSS